MSFSAAPSKPYHHGDLAQASLQVAVELLKEKGVSQLSLREVARRLGVSSTALYHHYPDKESLLAQLSRDGLEMFHRVLRPVDPKDPFDALVKMGYNYVLFFTEHPYYLDLLFLPHHKGDPAALGIWQETMRDLEELLVAQGWDAATAPVLGLWLWSGVHGLATMLRDGIIGNPEFCGPEASPAFHLSPEQILDQVLPLIAQVLEAARRTNS